MSVRMETVSDPGMGLYSYIQDNFPGKKVTVYVEEIPSAFDYLSKEEAMTEQCGADQVYDLFVALDCGDERETGGSGRNFGKGESYLLCKIIHITNTHFCQKEQVEADASSTSQILYTLMEDEKISYATACCLYTGIIHDTGVFKHSNTSCRTMEIAGALMNKGIPFGKIIDGSFYMKSYKQLQIMGRCLDGKHPHDGWTVYFFRCKEKYHGPSARRHHRIWMVSID